MYKKVSTNIRVLGFIKSEMEKGKQEFSIIESVTINGINYYTGLLDDGTKCKATYNKGKWIADDMEIIL